MNGNKHTAWGVGLLIALLAAACAGGCGSSGGGPSTSHLTGGDGTGTVTLHIAWPSTGRVIPADTESIKVVLGVQADSGIGPRIQVQAKVVPHGQSTATFTGVPAPGRFFIEAWGLNSDGVPIIEGWGDGTVNPDETSSASIEMEETDYADYSWFHGQVKWNGRATATEVYSDIEWSFSAPNGEFYIGVYDMTASEDVTLYVYGFQDKQVTLPLTAAGTVHELGDIAVVPETPSPAPLTIEKSLELGRAAEQRRQQH
jgi:hypothetical protein